MAECGYRECLFAPAAAAGLKKCSNFADVMAGAVFAAEQLVVEELVGFAVEQSAGEVLGSAEQRLCPV